MVNIGSAFIQFDQLPCVSIHRIGAGGGGGGGGRGTETILVQVCEPVFVF